MTPRDDVCKCEQCGNIGTVMHAGNGNLICCGKEMKLLQENTTEVGVEKHMPVIERSGPTVTVRVGGVAHPMEEKKHYIEAGNRRARSRLLEYTRDVEKRVTDY